MCIARGMIFTVKTIVSFSFQLVTARRLNRGIVMKNLTHKDFRLALKKWNWRLKNYDYSLDTDENDERMVKDIPELKKYEDLAYCTFCYKYADIDKGCPGCPFPKEEKCLDLGNNSIYKRRGSKAFLHEDASAETKEMVDLIRRLYKEWKNEK
jgi:hypothetical protein